MINLKNKKVTVMGLGLHGGALGTIDWLIHQGATVTVTDIKTTEQLAASVKKLQKYTHLTLILGQHRPEDFTQTDLVVRNPGVPRHSKYLELARSQAIPVEMDSSLFFMHCPSRHSIGVTGSKGKTTTSHAIAILFKEFNPFTVVVGVDGISPLKELAMVQKKSPVIFELSSWRLEALDEHKLSPAIAVVTSIYRDHLNTYKSFEEYIEMKKTVLRYQTAKDVAVLNYDDHIIRTWTETTAARIYWYSLKALPVNLEGIYLDQERVWVRQDGVATQLFGVEVLPLRAAHEQRNLLPAILLAQRQGMATIKIIQALKLIHSLPHRLERVRELHGVTYINDSAATMPDATIAALDSLQGKSIVHILGGSDKNLLFKELAQSISAANIRALVFLPGTATAKMKEVLSAQTHAPIVDADSMESAVRKATEIAQTGDTVLLSPGATSFGLFLHEFDRGNKFREAVALLPA